MTKSECLAQDLRKINRPDLAQRIEALALDDDSFPILKDTAPEDYSQRTFLDRLGAGFIWQNTKDGHQFWSREARSLIPFDAPQRPLSTS
jgi:hypothetical protein